MKKKLKLLFLLALTLFTYVVQAQYSREFKVKNYNVRVTKSYIYDQRNLVGYSRVRFGYRNATFLNPNYVEKVESGVISQGFGSDLGYTLAIYPFMFDLGGNWNVYTYKASTGQTFYDMNKDVSVDFRGGYAFASLFLMPDLGKFSDYVQPYLGAGYNYCMLKVTSNKENNGSNKDDGNIGKYALSAPMWKTGILFNFGATDWDSYGIIVEFRSTFGVDKRNDFSEWLVGLSLKYN